MSYRLPLHRVEFALRAIVDSMGIRVGETPWAPPPEEVIWREFVACMLGSGVPFASALGFSSHLGRSGMLEAARRPFRAPVYERMLAARLSTPISIRVGGRQSRQRYRFPRLRANHIRRTAEAIYGAGKTLVQIIDHAGDERRARRELVSLAIGIGPKQASLFLRNVGYARSLAILDRHVIRFVEHYLPDSAGGAKLNTISGYEQAEDRLRHYAGQFAAPLATLDVAIWIVMRAARREETT